MSAPTTKSERIQTANETSFEASLTIATMLMLIKHPDGWCSEVTKVRVLLLSNPPFK